MRTDAEPGKHAVDWLSGGRVQQLCYRKWPLLCLQRLRWFYLGAGALMASAFIELSLYTEGDFSKQCLSVAETQLKTLSSPEYLAEPGTNCNFILKHSVGNNPGKAEVDVPLTYADYYYVEALLRYQKVKSE